MSSWPCAMVIQASWVSTVCLAQGSKGDDALRANPEAIGALALFALLGIALILVLFVGVYVLRWTARRAGQPSEPRSATIAEDTWSQHKPPDVDLLGDVEDWDEDSEDG